ncbi:MAG: TPR repeat protein [Alteromonadaceae bacterium]|jgi:TPR repeat protein
MNFYRFKQFIIIELFFILIGFSVCVNANDLSRPLVPAQQLLSDGKFDQAFILFQPHAKADNELAQMTMGLFYKLAWGNVPQDHEKACGWFYQAAIANIPQAQKEFGDCINFQHFTFKNTKQDSNLKTTPTYWYEKAFESGLYDAGCDIGRLYLGTIWQKKNIQKAIDRCMPAAERSAISAQVTLGDIFLLDSPFQNIGNAEHWYQQAVQHNSGEAAFKLANLYYSAALSVENDNELMGKALMMMEKSSSLKYVPSYEKTASYYWAKLHEAEEEQASSILAKSYLWAKTAYQANPSKENLIFLKAVTEEMPQAWQENLDPQVDDFLD